MVEYLDRFGGAPPLVPGNRDTAFAARMLADIFDDDVADPMRRSVAEAFRGESEKAPRGIVDARRTVAKTRAPWASRIGGEWATGPAFTIADCRRGTTS